MMKNYAEFELTFEALHTERCMLCGKKVLLCFCRNPPVTDVPEGAILPLDEHEDVNLRKVLDRLKNQIIEVCGVCERPSLTRDSPRKKCYCCGNANKWNFVILTMPKGLVYSWCEQRLERDCEVIL